MSDATRKLPIAALLGAAWIASVAPAGDGVARAASARGRCATLAPELERATQALADAIAPGDRSVWEHYTDAAFVYVTEDNEVKTRAETLKDLTPLPQGSSGQILVEQFQCSGFGTFAVATYIMDEHERVQGQELHARYRASDTWHSTSAGWRLVASQVCAVPRDPPRGHLPAARLAEYEGEYALSSQTRPGSKIRLRIRRDGDHLIAERAPRAPVVLLPEVTDVFFTPGRPRTRRIFMRAANGSVTGFAARREGVDLVWRRVTTRRSSTK